MTERDEFTAADISKYTGASYRQIDYWTRTARLFCHNGPNPGPGRTRIYTFLEMLVAALLFRLSRSTGLEMAETATRHLRAEPTVDMVVAPYDPDEWILTIHINVAALRHELREAIDADASQTPPLRWENTDKAAP